MNAFGLNTEDALLLLEYEKSESITEVANAFKRDPSVVSRNLKRLSERLPVLEKSQGKWIVTELGKKFNSWTMEAVLSQQSILDRKIELKIASTREFANRYLIDAISKLFPKNQYHIHIITFESESEKLLLNGQVDLVFDCGKPYDPQIAFKRAAEEKMSLLVSKEFQKKYKIETSEDLRDLEYIHYSRNNLAKVYNMTGDKLKIGMTLNDIALVRKAVIISEGWSMLPLYTVKKEIKEGKLVEVKQVKKWKLESYKFGVWWNRDKTYLAPQVEIAVDWLSKQNLN